MQRIVIISLFLLAVVTLGVSPVSAGVVYVPFAGSAEVGDDTYHTRILISNSDPAARRRIEYYFIASVSDGTQRGQGPIPLFVEPGRTRILEVTEGSGILEIFAAPQITLSARLVRQSDGSEFPLPLIDSSNVAAADKTLHLQGWVRDNDTVTDFGLVNLGNQRMDCSVRVFRTNGNPLSASASMRIPARSHNQYDDALALLGVTTVTDARSEVVCNQPFWSYLLVGRNEPQTLDDLAFISPSSTGRSTLVRPGETASGEFDYLDSLAWSNTTNVRKGPWKNRSGFNPHAAGGAIGGYKSIDINGVTYPKGIAWFPGWGTSSSVEWSTNGRYLRFTATVRIDDEKTGEYEWAVVNRSTGDFIDLRRPPEGFRGPERNNQFRVGGGASLAIYGDGQLIYISPEFYAYGAGVEVDIPIQGVQTLRIELVADHSEQAGAPHRNGLTSTPALVKKCSWFDLINLADAKLFR